MWPDGRDAGRSIAERAVSSKQGRFICGWPGDLPTFNTATRHRTLVDRPLRCVDRERRSRPSARRSGQPDAVWVRTAGRARSRGRIKTGEASTFRSRSELCFMRWEQVASVPPPPSAETGRQTNRRPAVVPDDEASEAAGARTQDQRIKSPMLYRLSYSLGSHRTEAVGADNGPPSRTHRRRRGHAPRSARERT